LAIAILAPILLAGCAKPARIGIQAGLSSDLREVGKPWPVRIARFSAPVAVLDHDETGCTLAVGRQARTLYRFDYRQRQLRRMADRVPMPQETEVWGKARAITAGDRRLLLLTWADGRRLELSDSLPFLDGQVYAQAKDLSALAFYETTAEGTELVFYDQATASRTVWRRLPAAPFKAHLTWSGTGRYLVEELEGQLLVYDRDTGLVVGFVVGTRPSFAPTDLYLLFWRPNRQPGLLDPRTGYDWPLLPIGQDYRPLPATDWPPDGSRIFIQAEATAGAKTGASPFLLYVYSLSSGALHRYPLMTPIDLQRYSILLQAAQPEIDRLAGMIPRLKSGPLVALGTSSYLAGLDNRVNLLDLEARFIPLQTFAERVADLSLARNGDRLIVITANGTESQVYAWRLPNPALLSAAFPDSRDLTLAGVRLGSSAAEVRSVLGRPLTRESRLDPTSGTVRQEVWRYTEGTAVFANGRLVRVIHTAPGAATGRGIAIGAPQSGIYERYGRPDYQRAGYLSYSGLLEEATIKVAFTIAGGKVTAILIARAESTSGGQAGR